MIVEREIDAQPRVSNEKIGDRGADVGEAEIGWRDDAQFAARLVMQFAGRALGFLKVRKDAPALFVKGASRGGDADTPRGTVEQPRAQTLLELQHVFARCRP